ncbi:MAG TPA: hypothetical protein PLR06_10825, partial [Cyclobacteriaceae bacterium]|nr:hypothetical protein [Cyclobacteriaceae bacterium]
MRKSFFLFLLAVLVFENISGQNQGSNSESLKSLFFSEPSVNWGTVLTAHKNEITDSLIDDWREEAIALYSAEKYDKAHQLIDVCLFLTKTLNHIDLYGKCLLVKSETFYFQAEYVQSVEMAGQAAASFIKSKNTYQLARSKHRLGLCYYAQEEYKKSAVAFEESMTLKRQVLAGEPSNKTYQESLYITYDKYGDAVYQLEEYDKEIKINQEALALAKKYGWKSDEAYMLYCLGWTHAWGKKMYKDAVSYLEQSIQNYHEIPDSAFILYNYKVLIRVRERMKDSIAATADAGKASAIALKLKDQQRALEFVNYFIQWYNAETRTAGVIPFYESKQKLLAMLPDSVMKVKDALAEAYKKNREYEKSARTYRELLAMTTNEEAKASAYWSLGLVYDELKDYKKEIESFRAAIPYYSKQTNKHNQIILLSNIGITARNAEDSVLAYKSSDEIIALALKYGDPDYPAYAFDKAIDNYAHYKDYKRKIETMIMKYNQFVKIGDHERSGENAKLIGKAYEETLNDFEKAEQYYLLSMDHYGKTENKDAQALAYWNYAYNLSENRKIHKEAIEAYKKGAAIYLELKDTVDARTLYCNIGFTYRKLDDSTSAYAFHKKAIDLTQKNSDLEVHMVAYDKAIDTYSFFDDYKKERKARIQKYDLYVKKGDLRKSGLAAIEVGDAYKEEPADYVKANQYYTLSVGIFSRLNDKPTLALAYWTQAANLANDKKYTQGMASYDKAIALYTQLKDTVQWKSVLCNYANLYRLKGDSIMMTRKLQSAVALTERNSDPANLIHVYDVAIDMYAEMKNISRKRQTMIEKYNLYKKIGDPKRSGLQAQEIGKEYQNDPKNFNTAARYFDIGIKDLEKTDDKKELGIAYWNRAFNLDEYLNKNNEAIEDYKKSIALFKTVRDTSRLKSVTTNVAMIYRELNDSVNSYEFHKQAIDLTLKNSDPLLLAYCYETTAESYAHFKNRAKQRDMLIKRLETCEKAKNPNMAGEAAISLGKFYEDILNEYQTAETYYLKGIALHNQTDNLDRRANAYWNYAYNHGQRLNGYQVALDNYEIAFGLYMQNKDTSNAS